MKEPRQYLAAAQAALPTAEPATQALVALEVALADAAHEITRIHTYHRLLQRALRRGSDSPTQA